MNRAAAVSRIAAGAQHVVVYTMDKETEQPPTKTEVERKEGLTYRTVHARIDKVLWSKDPSLAGRPLFGRPGQGQLGQSRLRAILPFDSAIIGQGEYEGQVRTAAQNKSLIAEESPGDGPPELFSRCRASCRAGCRRCR
ncbi:hypothetical protein GCM10022419_083630 [Nonomuraea rosea]|uniref:Uncharacterized protein n=1 Tax=Nonomuraea rosea TaxID=638574 RepID=A0ABP6YT74_9ACTN